MLVMVPWPDARGDVDDPQERAALRRQDRAAFERLYTACAPALLRYLIRLCGDADQAQDLLQETFVKAYRALPATRPDLRLRPWLYKIATNTARSAARRGWWRRVIPFGQQGPDAHIPEEIPIDSRYAEAELVARALAAIPPDYAAALLLHWHEGFSIAELCLVLGVSEAALKKRLYRAKTAFRAAYTDECARAEEGR